MAKRKSDGISDAMKGMTGRGDDHRGSLGGPGKRLRPNPHLSDEAIQPGEGMKAPSGQRPGDGPGTYQDYPVKP